MKAWWLEKPTATVDHWTNQTRTGQTLKVSACQRVGTVPTVKFKAVCQANSACSPQDVLRLALLECCLQMLHMVSDMLENMVCNDNATGFLLLFSTPRTISTILISQCRQKELAGILPRYTFPPTCLLHSDIYTTDAGTGT